MGKTYNQEMLASSHTYIYSESGDRVRQHKGKQVNILEQEQKQEQEKEQQQEQQQEK